MATFQSWLVSVTAISSSKAFRRRLFKTNNRITREAQFSESFPNHQPQPNPVCSFLCLLHQALTFCRGAQLWCLLWSHYTHICSNMGVFLVFPEGKTSTPSKRHSFQTTLPNLGTFQIFFPLLRSLQLFLVCFPVHLLPCHHNMYLADFFHINTNLIGVVQIPNLWAKELAWWVKHLL